MTNWEKLLKGEDRHFLNWRYVSPFEVPDNLFSWLKNACEKAKVEKDNLNNQLVGHIKQEYRINNVPEDFTKFIYWACGQEPVYTSWRDMAVMSEDKPVYLDKLWVNYQKKYEFNPPHDHSGFVSFVIFVKIPYDLKEEEKMFPALGNNAQARNHTSKFTLLNPGFDGRIKVDPIDVDKSFEGKMLMFSAKQLHEVFPFYTSDDYRITVSGNLKFQV